MAGNRLLLFMMLLLTLQCTCIDDNSTDCNCPSPTTYNQQLERCQCTPNVSLAEDNSCIDGGTDPIVCQFPCETCDATSRCASCVVNYLLVSGECLAISSSVRGEIVLDSTPYQCPVGCARCSSLTTCDQCDISFTNNNGVCQPCPTGCKRCNSNICTECFDGYQIEEASCTSCSAGCFECSAVGCISCIEGYYYALGSCFKCGEFCQSCISTGCQVCYANYVVPTNGTHCVECMNGCSVCNPNNISLCQSCTSGYYDNAGDCTLCPRQCTTCQSQFFCLSCVDGYILQNQQCVEACTFPCLTCLTTNSSLCTGCYGGYDLSQFNRCVGNVSCNSDASCTFCPRNYFLESSRCIPCQASNCIRCSSQNVCAQCSEGYYLQNQVSCSPCNSSCTSCLSNTHCYTCADGYVMEKQQNVPLGTCVQCTHHCLTCKNQQHICMTCIDGFTLEDNKCVSVVNIGFNMQVSKEVAEFILETNTFKTSMMNAMGMTGPTSLIVITSIASGSTIINGKAIVEDNTQANTFFTNLQSQTSSGNLEGYTILSSSFNSNGFIDDGENNNNNNNGDGDTPSTETGTESSSIVGPIIGGVTGGLVVILGVVVCVVVRYRNESQASASGVSYTIQEITSEPPDLSKVKEKQSSMPEDLEFGADDSEEAPKKFSMEEASGFQG